MPKSKYDQTKVNDTPRVVELASVQDVFFIVSIEESGIFELPDKRFSKLYALSDINFVGVTDEEQKGIIINFSKVLKAMPCRFSYTVANERVDERQFHEKVLYRMKNDKYDTLRKSYNKVIADKVSDAKQGLYQTIYLTLTIKADDMADAKSTFSSMESAIQSAFVGIGINGIQGSVMRSVGINERMQLLYNFKFNFEDEIRARHDWINIISPAAICFENECFKINGQVGKVYFVEEFPKSLESDIIAALTKINCTSFITVANELLDISGFKQEIISTFTNYEEDQIIIIDPQSEYGSLARVTDGTVISFDSSKEFYLNPMDVDFEGADYGRLQEIVAEKADFILTLLSSCLKRDILPEEQGVIDKVIDRVYSENYAMRKRLNGLGESTSEFEIPAYMRTETKGLLKATELSNEKQIRAYSPTLQDIYQGLKDYGNEIGTHLAAAMEIFVNGSLNLFNHRTNVDLSNRFIVFDLSGLKENLRVTSMLIMMETVRCAIKSNAAKGRWTHLYIDEFHELLAIEQVVGFVLRLWKEIRKMSGILNGITQNMSDLLNNENGGKLQAILSNTEYFALLSQSTLDKEKLMQFLPNISAAMFNFVDNADSGTGLIRMGPVTVPFDMRMSIECEIYKINGIFLIL